MYVHIVSELWDGITGSRAHPVMISTECVQVNDNTRSVFIVGDITNSLFITCAAALESPLEALAASTATPTSSGGNTVMKRATSSLFPGLSSMETMQKSVLNAFSLKYSKLSLSRQVESKFV